MENPRKAKPTEADIEAARRLKAHWNKRARGLGLTQEGLALELGITQGAVSQYLNGKIPMNYRTLVVFCRALGIDPADVRTDLPEQQFGAPAETPDWTDVEAYPAAVALGDGALNDEWQESHKLKFRASSLRRKGLFAGNLAVFYGRGDSMEPRIHDGDAILVDTSDTRPIDDGIFMLESEDGAVAKRLSKIDSRWFVTSDNGADPKWRKPVPLEGKRPFKILGRVRWIGSWEG